MHDYHSAICPFDIGITDGPNFTVVIGQQTTGLINYIIIGPRLVK
jgi:hypothetical protein